MQTDTTAAQLYERANAAAADAVRWARQPNGELMAKVRHRDAIALRAMARARLTA